jgi:hypothetical protein
MGNLVPPGLGSAPRPISNALADAVRAAREASLYKGPLVTWPGCKQAFQLYEIGADFRPIAGVYIFCRREASGNFTALYVGETHDFKNRLSDCLRQHHALADVLRLGATHICALPMTGGLALREGIETVLRNVLDPPCNRQ